MPGVLEGLTVVELAGIGPGPFACMMLADHGARVIRVERPGMADRYPFRGAARVIERSRAQTVTLDLKQAEGAARLRALAREADALVEGFRPGVMERLGLGPETLLGDNPRLVYGRLTGWGQTGPKADLPGHDIDYIALAGALHTYGPAERPTFPLNAVADYGGGGMLMAFAVLAGVLSARRTGEGQVIDCAMTDGAALLSSMTWSLLADGLWQDRRGVNLLDGGAPFYDVYRTGDGKWLAVGAIEPEFLAALLGRLGLADDPAFARPYDPSFWPEQKRRLAALFATRSRDAWCALLENEATCVAPVLSLGDAPHHPHNRARGTFVEVDGIVQPAPAPRFSRPPPPAPRRSSPQDGER